MARMTKIEDLCGNAVLIEGNIVRVNGAMYLP
jgi:hypothetical protein